MLYKHSDWTLEDPYMDFKPLAYPLKSYEKLCTYISSESQMDL